MRNEKEERGRTSAVERCSGCSCRCSRVGAALELLAHAAAGSARNGANRSLSHGLSIGAAAAASQLPPPRALLPLRAAAPNLEALNSRSLLLFSLHTAAVDPRCFFRYVSLQQLYDLDVNKDEQQ